jgi:dihydrofolate reductase
MAGKVFFSVSMSVDGYIAPESLEDLMGDRWMELQQWVFPLRFFRENLKLGAGGEEGRDNDIVRATFERTGASVMGKRMFDAGERAWPEEAPFHTPVFVVTHERRDPWERPGGTTFHFVNDGIGSALDQAREAAGDLDVRVAGGGATILEYVNAGLIDEFSIALSPVLFGTGVRLFEGVDAGRVALEPVRAEPSPRVTHLTYAIRERPCGGGRVLNDGSADPRYVTSCPTTSAERDDPQVGSREADVAVRGVADAERRLVRGSDEDAGDHHSCRRVLDPAREGRLTRLCAWRIDGREVGALSAGQGESSGGDEGLGASDVDHRQRLVGHGDRAHDTRGEVTLGDLSRADLDRGDRAVRQLRRAD